MTQKNKELILKDLCARLPYGVKVECKWKTPAPNGTYGILSKLDSFLLDQIYYYNMDDSNVPFDEFKPYLFPLSSMTEEQKEELLFNYIHNDIDFEDFTDYFLAGELWHDICVSMDVLPELINWLMKNHFDYRGLIPMGLALDATGLGIY